jgi:hypothetical protein
LARFRFSGVGVDSDPASAPDEPADVAAAEPAEVAAAVVDPGGVVLAPQAAVASRMPSTAVPASTERTRDFFIDSKIYS